MKSQDPVVTALAELVDSTSEKLVPLLTSYEAEGVDGIENAWIAVIKDTLNEN